MIKLFIFTDKLSKTFIMKLVDVGTPNMRPAISQVIHSNEFKSVQSFTVNGEDGLTSCMAATTNPSNEIDSSVKIFCMDNERGMLAAIQEMQMDSPSLVHKNFSCFNKKLYNNYGHLVTTKNLTEIFLDYFNHN